MVDVDRFKRWEVEAHILVNVSGKDGGYEDGVFVVLRVLYNVESKGL